MGGGNPGLRQSGGGGRGKRGGGGGPLLCEEMRKKKKKQLLGFKKKRWAGIVEQRSLPDSNCEEVDLHSRQVRCHLANYTLGALFAYDFRSRTRGLTQMCSPLLSVGLPPLVRPRCL